MPQIFVAKKFKVLLRNEGERWFEPGRHDVEGALADHWWVKAHSSPVKSVERSDSQISEPETEAEIAKDAELASNGVTKEALIAEAKEIGAEIDGRWGLAKIQAAIDAKLAEGSA